MNTTKSPSYKFKTARITALEHWLKHSNRKFISSIETYENAYECRWQSKMNQVKEEYHCPLVCWIGSWGTNLSEMLSEQSIDNVSYIDGAEYDEDPNIDRIVRHVHRLMVVGEELLQGLGELAGIFGNKDGLRNVNNRQIDNFHSYVNNIIKHRESSCCYLGHHPKIQLNWNDCKEITRSFPTVSKNKFSECAACLSNHSAPLTPPSPLCIVQAILGGYEFCNSIFEGPSSNLINLCERYGSQPIGKNSNVIPTGI